jgi:hypothetical protein
MLGFIFLLYLIGMQLSYEKVQKKVDELGSASRKSMVLKKVEPGLTLIKANDTISVYNLKVTDGVSLQLFQHAGNKADILKVNECEIDVGLQYSALVDPTLNPRYLSSRSVQAYELKYRDSYYLVVLGNAAGASGKAIDNTLFFIFNLTSNQRVSVVSATSIYGTIANIADINQDGSIDIFLVRESRNKYSIMSFDIFSKKAVKIKGAKQIYL